MKIAIITQPLRTNYGGIMQNFALQQVLKRMGTDVETIDWRHYCKNPITDWLGHQKKHLFHYFNNKYPKPAYRLTVKEQQIIERETRRFIKRNISLCPTLVKRPGMFHAVDSKYLYDAYVVGSDQTWRPKYNSMLKSMFLDFVKRDNVRRIAYAVSFGSSEWEFKSDLTDVCAPLASKFNLVTVREKSGIKLCKEYLGVDALQVLDPTLLLSREDYRQLVIDDHTPNSEGYLHCYILDPSDDKSKLIESISKRLGLKPFTTLPKYQAETRTKNDIKNHIGDCIYPSVTKWIRGFMDAEVVITDSFHGIAMSIVFNKPFWVFENANRGNARIASILDLFGLKDRYINPKSTSNIKWDAPIDWDRVNSIKESEIDRSLKLLQNAIG